MPVPPDETPSALARVRTPAESKLEVAVPPKYALSNTESCEDDALANDALPANDGEVLYTSKPVPVSSVMTLANPRLSVTEEKAAVPLPTTMPVMEETPVPPCVTASVPVAMSVAEMLSDDVATKLYAPSRSTTPASRFGTKARSRWSWRRRRSWWSE
ncbi:MAG: hypothetical protein UX77_C0039G0003 [Parcubacteria group bacterium GW2011_GWA1_47_11]|nr:MAG: hypothetical protein UX77_C0039G0003 [Parcubacteria group bacterium GW2011_GWA1_47_11]